MKTETSYFLCKNGEEIFRGTTHNDCLEYLHAIFPEKWRRDFKYEGYSIKKTTEQLVGALVDECPDYCPFLGLTSTRQHCRLGTKTSRDCTSAG